MKIKNTCEECGVPCAATWRCDEAPSPDCDFFNASLEGRQILEKYAAQNENPSQWGPVKCYPAETRKLAFVDGFPDNIAGYVLTPSPTDYHNPALGNDYVITRQADIEKGGGTVT